MTHERKGETMKLHRTQLADIARNNAADAIDQRRAYPSAAAAAESYRTNASDTVLESGGDADDCMLVMDLFDHEIKGVQNDTAPA